MQEVVVDDPPKMPKPCAKPIAPLHAPGKNQAIGIEMTMVSPAQIRNRIGYAIHLVPYGGTISKPDKLEIFECHML